MRAAPDDFRAGENKQFGACAGTLIKKMAARSAHCLIVETHPQMRALLERFLTPIGICLTVCDDKEAQMALAGSNFDVIICSSVGAGPRDSPVKKLRALTSEVPIIALSPSSALPDRVRCFENGASEILLRPLSAAELRKAVEAWRGRSHRPFFVD